MERLTRRKALILTGSVLSALVSVSAGCNQWTQESPLQKPNNPNPDRNDRNNIGTPKPNSTQIPVVIPATPTAMVTERRSSPGPSDTTLRQRRLEGEDFTRPKSSPTP